MALSFSGMGRSGRRQAYSVAQWADEALVAAEAGGLFESDQKPLFAGHSFGGFTCTWLSNNEPRIKAIIPMAGAAEERTNYDCPVMLFIAAEDDTLGADRVAFLRNYYTESRGPRYSIEFKDAGHFSFTEMYQLKPDFGDGVGKGRRVTNDEALDYPPMTLVFPLVNGYSTAFFGKYLKGVEGYDAYLGENHHPDALVYQSEPTP